MKNLISISLTCVLFIANFTYGQTINKEKLDSLFNAIHQNNKGMGCVTLAKNGKILYQKAIGYSYLNYDTNEKTEASINTKYKIGSISKTFTSVLIFQLIEKNKLQLNTTLNTFFPQIPNSEKITIQHLLSHRSGIFNFTNDPTFQEWQSEPKTQEEVVATIANYKPVFTPDSIYEYSNSNYVLLGYIVEKLHKTTYKDILQKNICAKIGLKNTFYGGKINLENNETYSYIYYPIQETDEDFSINKKSETPNNQTKDMYIKSWRSYPQWNMNIPHGAGAIVSTTKDLTVFIDALFKGKLVSKASLEKMKTIKEECGMGLFNIPFHEYKGYGHGGHIEGFFSSLSYFPNDSLTIAYCTNGVRYNYNDILIGVLSIYHKMPYKIPTFKSLTLTSEELDKYVGTYYNQELDFKINIGKYDGVLIAKGTDQDPFTPDPVEKNIFEFEPAGVRMIFKLEKNEFILEQGKSYIFKKQ